MALDQKLGEDAVLENFLAHFQDHMIDDHFGEDIKSPPYYARSFALYQSSGLGKSRLLRQIGEKVPSFTITLGSKHYKSQSLPCPDDSIISYFKEFEGRHFGHTVVAALMSSLFQELSIYIRICCLDASTRKLASIAPLFNEMSDEEIMQHLAITSSQSVEQIEKDMEAHGLTIKTIKTVLASEFVSEDLVELIYAPQGEDDAEDGQDIYEVMEEVSGNFSIESYSVNDICGLIHQLRAGGDLRNQFLKRTVSKAKLLLYKVRLKDEEGNLRELSDLYLDQSQLCNNIEDFFKLIGSTTDGEGYDLSSKAEEPPHPHQFIFGVDEAHWAVDLIPSLSSGTIPQGVNAFLRVIFDLERRGITTNKTSIRRVWVGLSDTTSSNTLLAPEEHQDKNYLAVQDMQNTEKGLLTTWVSFAIDHAWEAKLAAEPRYLDNNTIGEVHHFKHLMLMGRTMLHAHRGTGSILELTIPKLVPQYQNWEELPLFTPWFDSTTFTIASNRFCLDVGMMKIPQGEETNLVTEAITKHMRVLLRYHNDYLMETSTLSEPMLAFTCLYLMNYGESVFESWTGKVDGYIMIQRNAKETIWRNMLKEISKAIRLPGDLVKVGKKGELYGRIVLTRARDCTLPMEMDVRKHRASHYTTLGELITSLIGSEAAVLLKAFWDSKWSQLQVKGLVSPRKHWIERVWSALVNFNQFIPFPSNEAKVLAVDVDDIANGFNRGIAYSAAPGMDAMICIKVPTEEMFELIQSGTMTVGETKLSQWKDEYVAIQNEWSLGQKADDFEPQSAPIVDEDGSLLSESAVLFILMELGRVDPFDASKTGSKSEVVTDYIAAGIESKLQEFDDDENAYFLTLQVRGLTKAYPCIEQIDERNEDGFYSFEESAKSQMQSYKPNNVEKTIPRHYMQVNETERTGVFHFRARMKAVEEEKKRQYVAKKIENEVRKMAEHRKANAFEPPEEEALPQIPLSKKRQRS
jgi:hypothetical protein